MEQVQVCGPGLWWCHYSKWDAVLLWGAATSHGVHGSRTSIIWGYRLSNVWHDSPSGESSRAVQLLLSSGFHVWIKEEIIGTTLWYKNHAWLQKYGSLEYSGGHSFLFVSQKEGQLTLRDLKNCKLSGNFFNILFNLNKFVAFETRDPFLIRQVFCPSISKHRFLVRGEQQVLRIARELQCAYRLFTH